MACNSIQSSSSSQMICKYDVFVSFRGKDTSNNFTDQLFGALKRKGIVTFRDNTKLRRGEFIAAELQQAIEGSRILIVVFSKNYASSTWCLRELVKILDCLQVSGKRVLPIFYDVDPSEVRKQSGDYEKAFAEHEERFKEDLEKMVEMQRWREALTQVANLSGWDIRNKPQYTEIEKIVEEVLATLSHTLSSLPNDLVGMHSPIEELEKLLHFGLVDDVRVVAIFGMGGIGKTTLAIVLYDKISRNFDACYFIDDVSKIYRDYGPIEAQKQLLCQTLKEENLHLCNLYTATNLIRSRLCHLRSLIILDNVDQVEQLEKLALNRECLGAGSRIIIISRDEHILKEYGVDVVYKVQLLNGANSLPLFCRKAFRCDDIMRYYKEFMYDVLKYANGLPLAIKVLGSFLFGRDVSEWRSALGRLRENPSKDIMDVLRLSFDGLEEMEKEIFLDIACFFNSYTEKYVKKVLNSCGFHSNIGMRVLIDKSLLTISNGHIEMHDLLQEMGRKIVRENSPKDQRKWSRLWLYKDFYNVMLANKEAENIEGIVLHHATDGKVLMAEALTKMSRLRLLIFHYLNFSGSFNFLSNELRYVEWHGYPFMYLPSSFQPNGLVKLILRHSCIKQLWESKKYLPSLRTLDLSHSKNLIKMPDFREVPNLEELILEGCIKLVQIDPSIGLLKKLTLLNLKDCKNLGSIPKNILGLISHEHLNLSSHSKVFNNQLIDKQRHVDHLKKLDISETATHSQSTPSIFKWLKLPFNFFFSRSQKDSASCLLTSLPSFSCLRDLDLSFCNLHQIPDAIGSLHSLETLNLLGNKFDRLTSNLKELSKLVYLNLQHCKQLKILPELPSCTYMPERREFPWPISRPGLYIFNCQKLGEREHSNSLTFSWMMQVLQANQESFAPFDEIEIIIPGSEIPRWFNNQSMGSSISIDPSPIMQDNNWIGVAYCAVFVATDDQTTTRNEWEPYIWIGFSNTGRGIIAKIPVLPDRDLVMVESDHMWLFYFSRKGFLHFISRITDKTSELHDLNGIGLATVICDSQGLHLEVKNCGYRWVFKQDLELLKLTMIHSGNSSAWNHKFLAIDDQAHP